MNQLDGMLFGLGMAKKWQKKLKIGLIGLDQFCLEQSNLISFFNMNDNLFDFSVYVELNDTELAKI